jgi:protein-tyrosine phosphatase
MQLQLNIEVDEEYEQLIENGSFDVGRRAEFEADFVVDGIYLGSLKATRRREALDNHGITAIVNISNKDLYTENLQGLEVLRFDLLDSATSMISLHFDSTFAFIEKNIASGGKVLIVCHRGISRSATLTAAYIMRKRNMTWDAALQIVKSARAVVNPNYNFVRQLYAYEKAGYRSDVAVANFEALSVGLMLSEADALQMAGSFAESPPDEGAE